MKTIVVNKENYEVPEAVFDLIDGFTAAVEAKERDRAAWQCDAETLGGIQQDQRVEIQNLTAEVEAQERMLSEKDASIRMQTKRHKCDQTQLAESLKVCNRLAKESVALTAENGNLKREKQEAVKAGGFVPYLDKILENNRKRIDDLATENFALAANNCIDKKGIVGNDGGTPICPKAAEVEIGKVAQASLASQLVELQQVCIDHKKHSIALTAENEELMNVNKAFSAALTDAEERAATHYDQAVRNCGLVNELTAEVEKQRALVSQWVDNCAVVNVKYIRTTQQIQALKELIK